MDCQEYREIIAAHVDGALSAEEQNEVELHLIGCSRCAQMFAWEQQAAPVLKHSLSTAAVPTELQARIKENLANRPRWPWNDWAPRRYAMAAAAVLIIVPLVAAYLNFTQIEPDNGIFADAIARHAELSQRIASVESHREPITPPSALDLTPFGYRLIERRATSGHNAQATTLAYVAPNESYVMAQEVQTARLEMAGGARYTAASGKEFFLRQQGDVNVIAWRDRDIVCVLASRQAQQQLIELAQRITARG